MAIAEGLAEVDTFAAPCDFGSRRATDEQRALIQRGAGLEGRSITDFILAAAQEKAMRVIQSVETIRLNAEESRRFAEALGSEPREPSERHFAIIAALSSSDASGLPHRTPRRP